MTAESIFPKVTGDKAYASEYNKFFYHNPASFVVDTSGSGDYSDIQTALDAVPSAGGTVYVKAGTYTITTGLLIKRSSTKLILDGGATVQCNGANVTTLLALNSTGLSRVEVRGGKWFQSNATAQGICFDFSNTPNHWCGEMRIEGFGTAIQITDTVSVSFYSQWENVQIFDCNNGILLSGTQANNNVFTNIRVRPKAGGAGIGASLVDCRGATFVHCDFEPSTAAGITGVNIDATSRECCLINCWIENNATGINIASGANRITLVGCTLTGNTADITDAGTATCMINTNRTGRQTGIVIPKMTGAQRDAIGVLSEIIGGLIYNTTTNLLNFYDGTQWRVITST